jgi:assimilatory nitrate reductase catalytic subunit
MAIDSSAKPIDDVTQSNSNETGSKANTVLRLPIVGEVPFPFERMFDGPMTEAMLLQPAKFGLGMVPKQKQPVATTNMVCGFCSTGCSLNVHLDDQHQAINLTPTTDYPVNTGMACPKGWEALAPLTSGDRGTTPLLKNAQGKLESVDWHVAMTEFTSRFKSIIDQHGTGSVAFLGTGQMPNEELAFLGSLAKFGMGFQHGDGNTRQCMATAVSAYKQSFGFDAPPYTYDDFEKSDVMVFVGSNLCIAHPIMWQRVLKNPNNPEIVVVDPRKTETAAAADQHLAIKPKSDLSLFYGIAHILIKNDWIDREFIDQSTSGFEDFANHVAKFDPDGVAHQTGISVDRLQHLAKTIADGKRVSFWWTMGINQSYEGTRAAQAIINLALITGNIGKPGTGANSITGQCNAMGSRLFSNTSSLVGGHDFGNANHRMKVAQTLGIDETLIPHQSTYSYDQIIDGILKGEIRGLWILATNTAHSWIHQNLCHEILNQLDFLVVQDMYPTTETAVLADLFLPAAGWGEKEGTFINSERRLGLIKKVARAPGQTLSDFSILKLIAQYWGCGPMFDRWKDPESVFQILKELTAGRPCDISGIQSYQMLDDVGGIQWPLHQGDVLQNNQRRLFEDGRFYHQDGKAKLIFDDPVPMPEPVTDSFPLMLLTGRGSASQWHTQTRTGKSSVLKRLYPQSPYVELNPKDAKRLGIGHQQAVSIQSRRGQIQANAFLTPTVQVGQVFMPMHYAEVNQLTLAHFDPHSRQPSYKNCAVSVTKISTIDSKR